MSCYARFEMLHGRRFRFDTRIYLGEPQSIDEPGLCVAAFVGKNPGSATIAGPNLLGPGGVRLDNTLRMIGNRFAEAYAVAKLPIPNNAFVRIWNLFYLCEPDYAKARRWFGRVGSDGMECETEKAEHPKIVWFGWGGADQKTSIRKARFRQQSYAHAFFFDRDAGKICFGVPGDFEEAAHPQGLHTEPIIDCLAKLLRA